MVGDRLRLQQILINLAGNALKFTARGHVLVSLRRLAHDAHLVRLRVLVADTGIGISAEQQQRIFEVSPRPRRPPRDASAAPASACSYANAWST